MKIDGQCHCGQVSYTATVDPATVHICHCTDCQALSGSAFRTVVPAREQDVTLRGEPRTYVKLGTSGDRRAQVFCLNCGSQMFATSDVPPGNRILGIRVGTCTQRDALIPQREIWCQSAMPWFHSGVETERFDQAAG
jgi:hypothetical protein